MRSKQRYRRVSLILPSAISSRSSNAVAGYQRSSTANSLPGAHNRLIASTAATRVQAASWPWRDRKSTRLNSSHQIISYAVFCLKKKKKENKQQQITQK